MKKNLFNIWDALICYTYVIESHTYCIVGEKPFECQMCGKRFSHSGSYSSHMTSKKCWSGRLDNPSLSPKGSAGGVSGSDASGLRGVTTASLIGGTNNGTTTMASGLCVQQLIPFAASMGHLQVRCMLSIAKLIIFCL